MRLFIGVELPDGIREGLRRRVEPFVGVSSARWIPEANYHVTVRFLGWVRADRLPELTSSLSDIADGNAAFQTAIAGLGSFPGGGEPARVLWAGLEDASGRVAGLLSEVGLRLSGWLPAHRGAHTPHVTLARCDPPLGIPEGWTSVQVPSEPFPVGSLTLFESRTAETGRKYRRLHRFPLRG